MRSIDVCEAKEADRRTIMRAWIDDGKKAEKWEDGVEKLNN